MLRMLGAVLILYGAISLAGTLYGYSLVRQAFAGVREIGVFAPVDRNGAVRGLRSISTILGDASAASAELNNSFVKSQASLESASRVATAVAESFRQVAVASAVQIFGVQPLAEMVQPFHNSSVQLDALSADLIRTNAALGANAGDMLRLSADFTRLKQELDGLAQMVARLTAEPAADDGLQRLEATLIAILVWIALQALASIAGGLAIFMLAGDRRP